MIGGCLSTQIEVPALSVNDCGPLGQSAAARNLTCTFCDGGASLTIQSSQGAYDDALSYPVSCDCCDGGAHVSGILV